MIRPLLSACAVALLLAAPAQAQKFISSTGETTRAPFGQVEEPPTETEAAAPEAVETALPEGDAMAEAAGSEAETETAPDPEAEALASRYVNREPAVIPEDDPVESFVADDGECNFGSFWDAEAGGCVTF